ncbi:MAG: 6-bladed beta-propeller [Balneola sp.]|nr:MAG: 6-bladed beta-propeller [Balneola sp.]
MRLFVTIVSVSLIVFLFIYVFHTKSYLFEKEAFDSQSLERRIDTLDVGSRKEVSLPDSLYRPEQILFKEGYIYILDFSDMRIYRFDQEWNLISIIGNGKGRGPGEALLITDFFVDSNFIWVVDSRQFKILKFDLNGNLVDELNSKIHPLRIFSNDESIFYLSLGDELLFSKINIENGLEKRFGQFPELEAKSSILYDGQITGGKTNDFYYLPFYYSKLYKFSGTEANRIQTIHLPDAQDKPELKIESGSTRITAPKEERINNTGIDVYNGKVFVATYDKGVWNGEKYVEEWKLFLDVYDEESGEYLQSYRVPGFFHNFALGEKKMYMILPSDIIYEVPFEY